MNCLLKGHNFINEVQTATQVFFQHQGFVKTDEISQTGYTVLSELAGNVCIGEVYKDGILQVRKELTVIDFFPDTTKNQKVTVKQVLYLALKEATGINPPWGALTGIRPTKIAHQLWEQGHSDKEVSDLLRDIYFITPDKTKLCLDVAKEEVAIIKDNSPQDYSLYVGIPFCPSQCHYCSFTSYPISKFAGLVDRYLECLALEVEKCGDYIKSHNLKTVYIGGGTPTSLNESQLATLLSLIKKHFPTEQAVEYTVEAGRADTVTKEKLQILKEYSVSRISVNPQTLNDETLVTIGRKHSVEDFFRAFQTARECGHNNINADLIIGLPGEDCGHVKKTMEGIIALNPESITVHTLAVKRASLMKEQYSLGDLLRNTEEMLALAARYVTAAGYKPYYMYRQKNSLGNFENVGYCKPGFEGIYNVQIMEEKQSILALGAGAVTKIVNLDTNRIERTENVKNVEEYIKRIDEMTERKKLNI